MQIIPSQPDRYQGSKLKRVISVILILAGTCLIVFESVDFFNRPSVEGADLGIFDIVTFIGGFASIFFGLGLTSSASRFEWPFILRVDGSKKKLK